ncbi:MAG TPA: regulatory protein RecX [Dehalococcoidia bacterium]|jgi:regulatory protein|nr:regulatory protein RecX [Dehalococcoidia bacterium]
MTMPRITSIEPQKRGGRVTIFADGVPWIAAAEAAVLECGLRRGDQATPELRERLEELDARHRAHEAALLLLSYRQRSEDELRQRLRRKAIPEGAVEDAIERLRRAGLIDDAGFARAWVESRTSGPVGFGRRRIQAELRRKGVAAEVVAQALGEQDEDERALAAALARAPTLRGLEYNDFRRRLAGFLQRRGFGYEAITRAVREAWRACGADEAD